ncbi:hypothetical protein INP83_00310 [Mucilaginibacter sp. 21P]|uniref:hypothetical protein n=1 Tax=Mucilaginibacter sp. 21P TaxID=2778902 RepID=UPI001C56C325|nr:hypothetical protein [Mucilaginibacter sp. 21P]QXV65579.1 hypothetical protein INP83_00310 [Mucilaginibacter sp. 21P]
MSNFKFFDRGSSSIAEPRKSSNVESIETVQFGDKRARYRADQQVITKHSGNVASHGTLKHEYLLELKKVNKDFDAKITITDAYGSYEPEMMTDLLQLGLMIDSVRHEQLFKLDGNGKPIELLNKNEMISNWMVLKTMQLKEDKLLPQLDEEERKQVLKEINSYCDTIFSEQYPMLDELYKNLFHFTVFDRYLVSKDLNGKDGDTTKFFSGMFNLPLTLQFVYENYEDKNDTYIFEKNSKLLYADYNTIIDIYEKQYQPVLHYSYTDYDYVINSRVEVDKDSNLITQAYVTIKESVKNNIESTIIYNLRKVEL